MKSGMNMRLNIAPKGQRAHRPGYKGNLRSSPCKGKSPDVMLLPLQGVFDKSIITSVT